jgi:phosphoglycolate phosphatase-like HAD superfamily hydrolase
VSVLRRPRAVLFDLDGTLADSMPLIAEAISGVLADHGYVSTPAEIEPRIGPPLDEMLRDYLGVSEDEAIAIFGEYVPRYTRDYAPRTPPMSGAQSLLDCLSATNVPAAIVSNKIERSANALLSALGWGDRFATVIGADTVTQVKPAPEPALEALRRIGVGARDAAFVGDTEIDMECGRAAGIPIVVGLATHRARESLTAAGATHTCANLGEVRALLIEGCHRAARDD